MSKKKANLYDVLEVDSKSSKETIKRAYRRKARATHPDVGGTSEQFALVKLAWDVLSNDERKNKYDNTGDYDESSPDNSGVLVSQLLSSVLLDVVGQLVGRGVDPDTTDLARIMTDCLKQPLAQINKDLTFFQRKKRFMLKCKGKFKSKASAVFESTIQKDLEIVDETISKLVSHKKTYDDAIDIMKSTSFDHKAPMPFWGAAPVQAFAISEGGFVPINLGGQQDEQ